MDDVTNTISAILVTYGGDDAPDLGAIVDSIADVDEIDECLIWHNEVSLIRVGPDGGEVLLEPVDDWSVGGRWNAMPYAANHMIYVQDDDCLIDVARIVELADPARLVANMPESRWPDYPDSTLVGWGAVVDRRLVAPALDAYIVEMTNSSKGNVLDIELAKRCSDVIVSSLLPRTVVDVGFKHLDYAETPARMHKQPGHKAERDLVLEQCRGIRERRDIANDDRRRAEMLDVLYVARNRLVYTRESLAALDAHTNWEHVRRLVIVDDDSMDGTSEFLRDYAEGDGQPFDAGMIRALESGVDVQLHRASVGGPVAAMNYYLDEQSAGADIFAKIDNDFVVCAEWLDEMLRVFDEHAAELDILGIEPFTGGPTPIPDDARTIRPAEHIGGKGLMRVDAWEGREMWAEGRQGFTQWQVRNEDVRCAWMTPDIAAFGIDQLPFEPWISLSARYTELEQHREWAAYHSAGTYWDWRAPVFEIEMP